ncbi:hypothetical protein ACFLUJ_08310 [Chloroflexota bacterium]
MPDIPYEDLFSEKSQEAEKITLSNREVILGLLAKAADDRKFLARLIENPYAVLHEFNLNQEERMALAKGDIDKLESWIGVLDNRLKTWHVTRLAQRKW